VIFSQPDRAVKCTFIFCCDEDIRRVEAGSVVIVVIKGDNPVRLVRVCPSRDNHKSGSAGRAGPLWEEKAASLARASVSCSRKDL